MADRLALEDRKRAAHRALMAPPAIAPPRAPTPRDKAKAAARQGPHRHTLRRNADPEAKARHRARKAVERALAAGWLVRQPCMVCEGEPTQAHHLDYATPLHVVWLCKPCHDKEHKDDGRHDRHL